MTSERAEVELLHQLHSSSRNPEHPADDLSGLLCAFRGTGQQEIRHELRFEQHFADAFGFTLAALVQRTIEIRDVGVLPLCISVPDERQA